MSVLVMAATILFLCSVLLLFSSMWIHEWRVNSSMNISQALANRDGGQYEHQHDPHFQLFLCRWISSSSGSFQKNNWKTDSSAMEHHPSSTAPHSIGLSQSFPGMPQAAPAPPPPVLLQGQQPPIQGQQPYHHLLHQQQQQLHSFWAYQMQEIEQVSDFKTHQLPLARIKKIMKADEDVRMISAEAPVLFAKACEMFILELTLRSWIHAEENKRRTLQRNDIAAAITRTDIFDFLVDIVPRDELKEEGLGLARGGLPEVSYFYPPIHQPQQGIMGSPSIMMGRPAMQMDPSLYMQQPRAVSMPYSMPPHQPVQQVWQQHQQQVPDGQPYGHPHQQQMPDGQSYGQHLPDGHSYGAPPPPPPPPPAT